MYYKVTRFAFVCLFECVMYFMSGLFQFGCHRCEFFFVLFRILIMTCSFAWLLLLLLLPTTRHTPMFITISPNRKCKSTNLACNKLFVRYVVEINKPYTEYECVHVCLNRILVHVFMKESSLVNFFVLLQHLCYVCLRFREVNFLCYL